jgi:hypothetical protein
MTAIGQLVIRQGISLLIVAIIAQTSFGQCSSRSAMSTISILSGERLSVQLGLQSGSPTAGPTDQQPTSVSTASTNSIIAVVNRSHRSDSSSHSGTPLISELEVFFNIEFPTVVLIRSSNGNRKQLTVIAAPLDLTSTVMPIPSGVVAFDTTGMVTVAVDSTELPMGRYSGELPILVNYN